MWKPIQNKGPANSKVLRRFEPKKVYGCETYKYSINVIQKNLEALNLNDQNDNYLAAGNIAGFGMGSDRASSPAFFTLFVLTSTF